MIENATERAAGQKSPGITPHANPMAMCPMARMCVRMMEKPHSGSLLMLPGALLIVLGVFIFLEPRILVWLVGTVAVLMGIMFFMMAHFIGRLSKPSF